MAHTHEDFATLMKKYNIPVKNGCSINGLGRLTDHLHDMNLFTGTCPSRRLFVNIPVGVIRSGVVSLFRPLLVYQVSPRSDVFHVSAYIPHNKTWKRLLYNGPVLDFSNLDMLLSGQSVTIYVDLSPEEDRSIHTNPELYVTLLLRVT